jgi:MFS family permease
VAEAGFFPGVTFYLASWFPARYRARILAWFLASIPVSALIGGPLSGALLRMDGVWGMAGWRWLFLLESLPCVLIGLLLLRLMTDRPEVAGWLTAEQRTLVVARLRSERRVRPVSRFAPALRDARVWVMSFIYLGFLIGAYGVQVWLPQIIKQSQFSDFAVGLLSAIPYVFAVVGMLVWASAVDRRGARIANLTATCLLATAGFGVALLSGSFVVSMVGLTVALIGVNAARAVFWAMPSQFLEGEGAAGGLALINSIGTAGGFFGPFIIGWLKELTGSFTAGLMAMAGFLLVSAALAASLKLVMPGESGRERADRRG